MEITSKLHLSENPSSLNSPSSHGSNSLTSPTTNNGGSHIPITRSDPNNPYPTTFVTADTSSFKQVVQLLTGSSETSNSLSIQQQKNPNPKDQGLLPPPLHQHYSKNFTIPPIKSAPKKQQGFKLYERRNILRNSLMINPLTAAGNLGGPVGSNFSPRKLAPEILSPSLLDFPSLTLSPVTPLKPDDPFDKGSPSMAAAEEEERRAIAEKGFYLHPSPRSMANRESERPRLLPLFPVTSPRAYEA